MSWVVIERSLMLNVETGLLTDHKRPASFLKFVHSSSPLRLNELTITINSVRKCYLRSECRQIQFDQYQYLWSQRSVFAPPSLMFIYSRTYASQREHGLLRKSAIAILERGSLRIIISLPLFPVYSITIATSSVRPFPPHLLPFFHKVLLHR